MRIRRLKIFTVVFMALVILAAYGLALLRTYTFKPSSRSENGHFGVVAKLGGVNLTSRDFFVPHL